MNKKIKACLFFIFKIQLTSKNITGPRMQRMFFCVPIYLQRCIPYHPLSFCNSCTNLYLVITHILHCKKHNCNNLDWVYFYGYHLSILKVNDIKQPIIQDCSVIVSVSHGQWSSIVNGFSTIVLFESCNK